MTARAKRARDSVWGVAGTVLIHGVLILILTAAVHPHVVDVDGELPPIRFMKVIEPPPLEDWIPLQPGDDLISPIQAMEIPTLAPDTQPPEVAPPSMDRDTAWEDNPGVLPGKSPLVLRGVLRARSGTARDEALGRHAGGMEEHTERAVKRALAWLRDHQYPDGSWGPEYRTAMTGLALLTMLAHGETTGSPEYGTAIRLGLQYLLRHQSRGIFGSGGRSPHHLHRDQVMAYEHAVATYAVAEGYSLTSIPMLKTAMEDAVQVIIDGQHGAGTWDYGYNAAPDAHNDVSLAGWHIQALKAALIAGANNAGLEGAIGTAVRGLKSMAAHKDGGLFSYSTRDPTHPADLVMTGVAVLCMQLTGHAIDAEARYGVALLKRMRTFWSRGDAPGLDQRGTGRWPFYAWYYIGQTRFHQGGPTWYTWNRAFTPTLCRMQNADGSWCPAPDSVEARFGPVYHTALATLMLEIYYRVLPTYTEIEARRPPPTAEPADGDLVIEFG